MAESHDELLSAYLDGELSAAEQAEVERFLAVDPQARQLLDELRGLSTAIRELPREKLGQDLTQPVLHAAQQRMLGENCDNPQPLAGSLFHRFVNRRTIVWLSITAAVAVMIAINDRRPEPGPQAHREIARSRLEPEKVAQGPADIPSIGAADSDEAAAKKVSVPVARQAEGKPGQSGGREASQVAEKVAAKKSARPSTAGKPSGATGSASATAGLPGSAGSVPAQSKVGGRAPAALVVRCDIGPKAADNRAFEKLLDANGVSWREESLGGAASGDKSKKEAKDTTPLALGPPKLLYADATPPQLAAILTKLAAQPDVYLAVHVDPAMDAESRQVDGQEAAGARMDESRDKRSRRGPRVDYQVQQAPRVGGRSTQLDDDGRLPVTVRESLNFRSSADESHAAPTMRDEVAPPATEPVPPPRRSVLFVLHVVQNPATTAPARPAAPMPNQAKPAEQNGQPGEASRKGR